MLSSLTNVEIPIFIAILICRLCPVLTSAGVSLFPANWRSYQLVQ
jgi:hypothetical protein